MDFNDDHEWKIDLSADISATQYRCVNCDSKLRVDGEMLYFYKKGIYLHHFASLKILKCSDVVMEAVME